MLVRAAGPRAGAVRVPEPAGPAAGRREGRAPASVVAAPPQDFTPGAVGPPPEGGERQPNCTPDGEEREHDESAMQREYADQRPGDVDGDPADRPCRRAHGQFSPGSYGMCSISSNALPFRCSTARQSSSGSPANASSGSASTTIHDGSASSSSSCPAPQPE